MDESLGNIIYLIIVVVGILSGLWKKKKKAIFQPVPEEIKNETETSSLNEAMEQEAFFDEDFRRERFETEKPMSRTAQMKAEVEKKNPEKEIEQSANGSGFNPILDFDREEEAQTEEEIDWKQAIIYKEILDPKYN